MSTLQKVRLRNRSDWLKLLAIIAGILLINVSLWLDVRLAFIWVLGFLLLVQLVEPIFALILMIPVYFRGFGLFPRQFLESLLGPVEPRDIAFLFLITLTIVICMIAPRVLARVRRSMLFFPILILVGYVLLRIILTGLEVGSPILALRTGRSYFSYLVYFSVIIFVSNPRKGRWLLNGVIIMGVILALITFTAQVAPSWFTRHFSTTVATLSAYQGLGVKAQTPGIFIMFLAFTWCFFRWLQFRRYGDLALLFILGSGFLLQKYRTFYILLPLSIFLVWVLARKTRKMARRQLVMMIGVAIVVVVVLALILAANPQLRAAVARFTWEAQASATGQVQAGTTYERIQEASWRLQLFEQRPILGLGFIHNELAPQLFGQKSFRTDHISYADILVTGGSLLALSIGWLMLSSWRFLLKGVRRQMLEPDIFWIVAGAMAFSLMTALGVTWSLFGLDTGIIPLVLSLGLAERFLAFDVQHETNKTAPILQVVDRKA